MKSWNSYDRVIEQF